MERLVVMDGLVSRLGQVRLSALSGLLACVVAPGAGMSLVYRATPDEVMVDRSPLIVFGQVASESPGPSRGFPATDYLFRIEEVVKGYAASAAITVRQPGGLAVDGGAAAVVGLPRPRVGDRMLLFLRPESVGGTGEASVYTTVDFGLGMFFEVVDDGRALLMREASLQVVPEPVAAANDRGPDPRLPRDEIGFLTWIAERAAGREPAADYFVTARPAGPASVAAPYRLLNVGEDCAGKFLPIRWAEFDRDEPVPLVVGTGADADSPANANGLRAVNAAIRAWNREPGSTIRLVVGEVTDRDLAFSAKDGVNSITFEDPADEIFGDLDSNGLLAATFTFWDCRTRHGIPGESGPGAYPIVEANLTIQDGTWSWLRTTESPRRNYEEIVAHELGHALGIDHPCGTGGQCDRWTYEALMRGWVHEDGRGPALNVDDREAARALYPGGVSRPGDSPEGSCVADESSLCLLRGRYRVVAEWSTATRGGSAAAVGLTGDTGLFWFFDPGNVEVVVKVLDGCGINGRHWVFAAGLTDVGVELEVEDTRSDRFWARRSPGGTTFRPILDTMAFPCPEGAGLPPGDG